VDEETERLLERQAGHRRREAADRAELADRLAVDTSPEGELMRRYQLDNDRKLDRALNGLVKLRRAAGAGVAGDPAPEGGCEPEPEPVATVEPENGPADGPEGEADAEVQPKAEDNGAGDRDPGACGLPSSFGLDPSSIPGPEWVAPAAAVAAGEPAPAGIAAPARAAAEPESRPVPQDERSCPPGGTRPHEDGRARGFSSPAPCSEEPSPVLVRGVDAEESSRDEPVPPAHGDEAPRNEPDPATDGDPIARNEPCAPGGDPIAPNEPAGSRRIAAWSVPAVACALVILLAAGLNAAWAGPVAGPNGRPSMTPAARAGPDVRVGPLPRHRYRLDEAGQYEPGGLPRGNANALGLSGPSRSAGQSVDMARRISPEAPRKSLQTTSLVQVADPRPFGGDPDLPRPAGSA
jgi:hypothetical protein